ncbi:hypothetical protein ES288_A08G245400v1 [Gossypium darwinii]|uniref:Uncharacterized protein n=1 Tax=Gossypium darwinii TaxID=34276 RepID=A0A5D2FQF6_GOSDA|nr:hypothetical protein ES288_A08G245400v1 [Gossypium darwinii]TYH07590.1 hypothetical protein ES288_A08G245400v1 [Gossypium darwinii]
MGISTVDLFVDRVTRLDSKLTATTRLHKAASFHITVTAIDDSISQQNLLAFCYLFQRSLFPFFNLEILAFSSPLHDGHSLEYHPTEIPNHVACNPACASATNGDAISEWITDLDAKISPLTSCTTSPEANLKAC